MTYIVTLNSLWESYINNNHYSLQNAPFSWRSLDVGLRLIAWVRMVEIYEILGFEINSRIYDTMVEYNSYLLSKLDYKRTQSNWTAIEAAGVIVYSSKFNFSGQELDFAIETFEHCLDTQIGVDGLQWEQSFMYHHEVLIACLHVVQSLGKNTSQFIKDKFIDMGHASRTIMRTDYKQVNFGDSDYEDMRTILLAFEKMSNEDIFYEPTRSGLYDFLFTGNYKSSLGARPFTKTECSYLDEAGIH